MHIDLVWQNQSTPLQLVEGITTLGGAQTDTVKLPDAPRTTLLELTLKRAVLTVMTWHPATIGGARFPPKVPRLLLEGDSLEVDGLQVKRPVQALAAERRQRVETAFVAKALLRGETLHVPTTRAATLTCVTGVDVGTSFALATPLALIGRADEVDVRIHDRSVSRKHARLSRRGALFFVEPLQSTNGVYVNGRLLRGEARLNSGEVLELGQTVLRFDGPEQASADVTVIIAPDPTPTPVPPGPTLKLPTIGAAEPAVPALERWLMRAGLVLAVAGAVAAIAVVR